jgi:CheY-like chemotaxis protein
VIASTAKHLLLVDDDEAFREATAATLRAAGYGVREAPDYRLALEILEGAEHIDVLIVDLVMPGAINGLALARMARMRRPGLRVIYISGFDIQGFEHETLGTLLRKPVSDDQLLTEIALTLSRQPG